ncbi:mitochondrial calcium uniporter regulator 1 [Anolis carolinensis]|uniref:mitochondrial calcium uniporter regulator 1 n=1 Tax=Anolis carolinensis TaxID=28377 RepID=UPI002F2B4CD0
MLGGRMEAAVSVVSRRTALFPLPGSARRRGVTLCPVTRRCLGDGKHAGSLAPLGAHGASAAVARGPFPGAGSARAPVSRFFSRAVEGRDVNISASPTQSESTKGSFPLSGSRKLYFDTHALVRLLEANGFTTQQSEVIVSALMNIMKSNMDVVYKDMLTKIQQEIALQQIMSRIGVVKKDMIILEKSEFSALRAENEKTKLELQQLKKQVMDETSKVRTDSKLDFNLEKSRVKELFSHNERKVLKMRTEIVELHAQQDRALTQTDRKIDTEVAGLKTMLESHKLDNIKYLAGSVFTCLTVALGFYRLWV